MAKKNSQMGRPPIALKDKKTFQVSVAMTDAERVRVEEKAKELGLSISELLMKPWRKKSKEL